MEVIQEKHIVQTAGVRGGKPRLANTRITVSDVRAWHFRMEHPGIAYCHIEARSVGKIIRSLHLIYEVLTPAEMAGRVEYL